MKIKTGFKDPKMNSISVYLASDIMDFKHVYLRNTFKLEMSLRDIFYPTAFEDYGGIVFTHGIQLGTRNKTLAWFVSQKLQGVGSWHLVATLIVELDGVTLIWVLTLL